MLRRLQDDQITEPFMQRTEGRLRVLVTGGARGLGLAIAKRLAADGARVLACDINLEPAKSQRIASSEIEFAECDVSKVSSVRKLFDDVVPNLGGLDALINNAGITGPFGPVEELSAIEWAETISVNLVGQFHCAQKAVPLLKAAGGGSIVNISSVAGRLGYPLRTAYAASKWGIIGLTQSLAMELGASNIRVNAVLPGIVENERQLRQQDAQAARLGISRRKCKVATWLISRCVAKCQSMK